MTRVLYVETGLEGHREKYLKELLSIKNSEEYKIIALLPNKIEVNGIEQFEIKSGFDRKRTIIKYIKFINEVKKVADENNVDIIHFLGGDSFYKYFGFRLAKFKQKVVITYHHMVLKGIKEISIKRIFKKITYGIVHTEDLFNKLQEKSIKNSYLVNYPMLDFISQKNVEDAKKYYGLPQDMKVLGMIGGTSKYKGLDFLLQALNKINKECCLFVAGKIYEYDYKYIRNNLKNPKIILVTALRKLSDEDFADAIQASDVIMLPYRLEFDGASGILIESLFHNKHVIGSNHGSMGDLIRKYDLGRTFETNNMEELINKIKEDLAKPYILPNSANEYKKKLLPARFLEANKELYDICLEQKLGEKNEDKNK